MREKGKIENDVSAGQLVINQSVCDSSPTQFLAARDETSSNFFDITIREDSERHNPHKLYLRRVVL
jgi:hypothetical protein